MIMSEFFAFVIQSRRICDTNVESRGAYASKEFLVLRWDHQEPGYPGRRKGLMGRRLSHVCHSFSMESAREGKRKEDPGKGPGIDLFHGHLWKQTYKYLPMLLCPVPRGERREHKSTYINSLQGRFNLLSGGCIVVTPSWQNKKYLRKPSHGIATRVDSISAPQ